MVAGKLHLFHHLLQLLRLVRALVLGAVLSPHTLKLLESSLLFLTTELKIVDKLLYVPSSTCMQSVAVGCQCLDFVASDV